MHQSQCSQLSACDHRHRPRVPGSVGAPVLDNTRVSIKFQQEKTKITITLLMTPTSGSFDCISSSFLSKFVTCRRTRSCS